MVYDEFDILDCNVYFRYKGQVRECKVEGRHLLVTMG